MPRKGEILWTREKIKEGFEKFVRENRHLPTSIEVDKAEYLPTSRWIQKKYGGLEDLRRLLGYKITSFRRGERKTKAMRIVNRRGRKIELDLEKFLQAKFGEMFVHSEKYIGNNIKNRIDFLVYSPDGKFGIDVFYATSHYSLITSIYIKTNRYKDLPYGLYLVVANRDFSQEKIDKHIRSKKSPLPRNVQVVTTETFKKLIEKKKAYKVA